MSHRNPRSARLPALLTVTLLGLGVAACTDVEISAPEAPEIEDAEFAPSLGIDLSAMEELPSGVWIQDLEVGDGAVAESGDGITVHFEGWLRNGQKFDSSRDSGRPVDFRLGQGQLIEGWEVGIPGMRAGGVRRLIIPPELGFGVQGTGSVPRNAILVFEVELLEVQELSSGG